MRRTLILIVSLIWGAAVFGAEIGYDDGTAEGCYTWEGYSIGPDLLGAFAMRMTADVYPVELVGVEFGFSRVEYWPGDSDWNFVILGHDEVSDEPDESEVLHTSADILTDDMGLPIWPSFEWYAYEIEPARLELSDDWWVVCHGHWYGTYADWYIVVDETDDGTGRDRTKTAAGWVLTSSIPLWEGGDLFIHSIVSDPDVGVSASSFGRIKALYE